jgi:prepilin-type processing-associated H-X9-DG protein
MPWAEIGLGFIFLGLLALVLKPSGKYVPAVAVRRQSAIALSNIKQVDLGFMMFENDYNHSAPEMRDPLVFQGMLRPYIKNSSVFKDPDTGWTFAANGKLSRVDMSKLTMPANIVTLYDPDPVDGQRIVAYADGHVKKVPEKEFEIELAINPHAPPDLGLYEGKWQTPIGEVRLDMSGGATLRSLVASKDPKGKLTVDDKDNLSISFGPHQPSIVGTVTWISVDDLEVRTRSGTIRMSRIP